MQYLSFVKRIVISRSTNFTLKEPYQSLKQKKILNFQKTKSPGKVDNNCHFNFLTLVPLWLFIVKVNRVDKVYALMIHNLPFCVNTRPHPSDAFYSGFLLEFSLTKSSG